MNDTGKFKVLVLWADNRAANYGLRVLASGARSLVEHALPDREVSVDFQDFGPGDSHVSFGTKSIVKDLLRINGPIKRKIRQYDLILDTGAGDSFADIYGLKRLSFIAYAHLMARVLKRPIVFLPQTIGPFNTRVGRVIARMSLRQASLVFARDSQSAAYSTKLARPVDFSATDLVFSLDVPKPNREDAFDVMFNVSGLLWFADDHVDSYMYRRECEKFVLELTRSGRDVTLMAHVVRSPSGNDDVDACWELSRRLKEENVNVRVVVPNDLQAARANLAGSNVVVGARMHACLNALSVGTPAIPWAYSRKFVPLLGDLGWSLAVDLRSDSSAAESTLALLNITDWEMEKKNVAELRVTAERSLAEAAQMLGSFVSDGSFPNSR